MTDPRSFPVIDEASALAAPPKFLEPRAAYIHVPFCAHRCGYCNFTVVTDRDDLVRGYLRAIEIELSWLARPRTVDTLFIGGGTPTYLEPAELGRLLTAVGQWFPRAEHYEFTVEANPSDITSELLNVLVAGGVTRLSLGAQSFQHAKLDLLERDHDAVDIEGARVMARRVGLDVSLDLIFGTPGETVETWQKDLQWALEIEPEHISAYGLTFEQGTSFWTRLRRGQLTRLDEELEGQMYEAAIDTLTAAGFEHYEVSNFAQPGKRCRHNETYWAGDGYFAAGPGAARYVNGRREMNHRSTTTWLRRVLKGQSPVAEFEELAPEDRARELLVFALRRLAGVDRTWFTDRTGFSIETLAGEVLRGYVAAGLFADDGQRLRLTRRGLLISDALWPALLRV